MKKIHISILFILAVIFSLSASGAGKLFKDGVYSGETQSRYTSESFWGQATVEIKNDKVVKLTFQILDKDKNEVFGPEYEKKFKDNAEYVEQCRNEVKSLKVYTEKYLKTSNLEQVDAITGATWSYNMFKDALKIALEKARNK